MKKMKSSIRFIAMLIMCCLIVCGVHTDAMAKSVRLKNITNVSLKIDNRNVTNKTCNINAGDKKQIVVSALRQNVKKTVQYSSDNKKVVSINRKGVLTAKKEGTANICVTIAAKNYKTKTVWIKVQVTDTSSAKKNIVVYFSSTDHTKRVAELIADSTGADIYRIEAVQPYTPADLDYTDSNSRTSKENRDASARPAIAGKMPSLDEYSNIYIGYPIWHGQAPKIMYSFVEHYNLSGKTVIPFCTSASSGIGTSAANLERAAGWKSTWLNGRRFSGSVSQSMIESWISELGVNHN